MTHWLILDKNNARVYLSDISLKADDDGKYFVMNATGKYEICVNQFCEIRDELDIIDVRTLEQREYTRIKNKIKNQSTAYEGNQEI